MKSKTKNVDSSQWYEKWLHICLVENLWIQQDHEPTVYGEPAMTMDSFKHAVYDTPFEMALEMIKGNWNTGAAFVYKDQCWVNQMMGGSEFLVIKQDRSFESVSARRVAGMDGQFDCKGDYYDEWEPIRLRSLIDLIIAIDKSTVEECTDLDYRKHCKLKRDGSIRYDV